jgi:hypothetical protein
MGQEDVIPYETFASAIYALKRYQEFLPRFPSPHGPLTCSDTGFIHEHDYLPHFELVHGMIAAKASRNMLQLSSQFRMQILADLEQASSRSLYQWCRMLVHRQCADERDKVYAALGLANNTMAIFPNYNLSFDEVRLDLTRKSLKAGDFSPLHDAPGPRASILQSPGSSFVPSLRAEHRPNQASPLGGYELPRYRAELSRPCHVNLLGTASVSIGGVPLDEVYSLDAFEDILNDLVQVRGASYKPEHEVAYMRSITCGGRTFMASADSLVQYVDPNWHFGAPSILGFLRGEKIHRTTKKA